MLYFDKDCDGCVEMDDFLYGIRGRPNQERQTIVDNAFAKFDRQGTGFIDITDVK
jgi:Ca2+-binding EF-hand superfamily protein